MIKEKFDLTGKVAIITGSSKGIGEAIARGLAEFGAKVVISSRKQEAVDEVVKKFKADELEAIGIACHVGKEDQLHNLVDKTLETYGRIDILVNNAAINPVYDQLLKVNAEVFDKIMSVNVRACFSLANLCYPHMKKNGGGAVINIASVEGLRPSSGQGLYSVSKAALIMLTKSQAKEWGRAGIRSNAICPGLIKTKFSAVLWQDEAILKQFVGNIPAGRMGTSEEIAGLAAFLASEAGAYCTGEIFTADGGHMITG